MFQFFWHSPDCTPILQHNSFSTAHSNARSTPFLYNYSNTSTLEDCVSSNIFVICSTGSRFKVLLICIKYRLLYTCSLRSAMVQIPQIEGKDHRVISQVRFGWIKAFQTCSNHRAAQVTKPLGVFTWVQGGSTMPSSSNYRGYKDHRVISHEFRVVQIFQTLALYYPFNTPWNFVLNVIKQQLIKQDVEGKYF